MKLQAARVLGVFLLLMCAFAIKGSLVAPPSASAQIAAGQFDTFRALARLQRILGDQRPHSVDTGANDAVRERLVAELRAIGLTPQVREADDCQASPRHRTVSCSHVRNVVASIGPATGRRLLLNAHYDSSPAGPGASDDGIGIATLLEVAAVLKVQPPARPVTFLFNEGEEFGLNGAGAFAAQDPLASSVDALINIEARGVSGPATMFETNVPNGPAIIAYAQSSQRPNANSIATDMATLIPNTTDVEVFKARGWKTLSYAIIGNETRYHTSGDTVEALNRASLFQMGSEVLAATRVMARADPDADGGRMVFTDIAGRLFVALPLQVSLSALGVLAIAALAVSWKIGALKRPLATVVLAWVAGVALAVLVGWLFGLIRPGAFWRASPLLPYLTIYAVVLTAQMAVLARMTGGIKRHRLRAATWLLTLVLGCVATIVLPGASIFFIAAPAVAIGGLLANRKTPQVATMLFWLAAAIQLLMFSQLLAMLELLLVDGPLWAVAPLAGLAALPFLIEVTDAVDRWILSAVGVIAGAVVLGAMLVPRTTAERPGRLTLDYLRDDVAARRQWSVSNGLAPLPDGWSRFGRWKQSTLRNSTAKRWLAPAPTIDLPAPRIAVLSSVAQGRKRTVRLSIDPAGADTVGLRFAKDVPVLAMGIAGQARAIPASAGKGTIMLRCSGRSCGRMVFEVRLGTAKPVVADLIRTRYAMVPQGKPLIDARPSSHIPQYLPDSSVRIVPARL
ncbi:M20/M25/M40 family metallo-hydrolase [Sphingomonas edaphi]|uniref:Peptidase M28 domain-containing protein n=1 Tax=Sphingomonas edaphi TaxID=2315689 RepID=A0A418Q133_9SPHN|nr:M20/M25/M40 family metallo-hydrolase [Sphingomonas edaphi]RIX31655.1 hypothetical protein D3M59_01170 [Sphingomonas edaphi]